MGKKSQQEKLWAWEIARAGNRPCMDCGLQHGVRRPARNLHHKDRSCHSVSNYPVTDHSLQGGPIFTLRFACLLLKEMCSNRKKYLTNGKIVFQSLSTTISMMTLIDYFMHMKEAYISNEADVCTVSHRLGCKTVPAKRVGQTLYLYTALTVVTFVWRSGSGTDQKGVASFLL